MGCCEQGISGREGLVYSKEEIRSVRVSHNVNNNKHLFEKGGEPGQNPWAPIMCAEVPRTHSVSQIVTRPPPHQAAVGVYMWCSFLQQAGSME